MARKGRKLLKIEAKKKKKGEQKKAPKSTEGKIQLVLQPAVPITLEEYMLGEWFRMVEEEDEVEEVFYSYRKITVDIKFQERSVKITQDNHTQSNAIITTYRPTEVRARLPPKYEASIDEMRASVYPQFTEGNILKGTM